MKKLLLGLAMVTGLMTVAGEASADVVPSETGDYCRDQALDGLRMLYGDAVEIKEVTFVDGAHETVNYWMKTNVCEGYIVASFVRNASCKAPHYGFVPQYIKRLWAHGGTCVQVLPADISPEGW